MSIPYLFQPIELVHGETGMVSTIVDGGVVSKFPVWIFDTKEHAPRVPTFGFKLIGGDVMGAGLNRILPTLGWAAQMGSDIFHTATEAWDKYWVSHATAVRTCVIPAGDVGTTDFDLSATQQQSLLDAGKTAARAFLDQWDPRTYVNSHGRGLERVTSATP